MNLEFPVRDIFPVDLGEEWMLFDFICSLFTCSKTLTRVPVEQMDNQILGFYRHAHWKFQDAALDVVEQLRSKNHIRTVLISKLTLNLRNMVVNQRSSRTKARQAGTSRHSFHVQPS